MERYKALERLKKGNDNFARGCSKHPLPDLNRLKQLEEEGQTGHAFATIITCSDSRVTPELIFDCGLGDLFVIRTAGNACFSKESLASIEYGITTVETPLLVVMGHGCCGAVITAMQHKQGADFSHLPAIHDLIGKLADDLPEAHDMSLENITAAIHSNIFRSIERIHDVLTCARKYEEEGRLLVLPAYYCISTGRVSWL